MGRGTAHKSHPNNQPQSEISFRGILGVCNYNAYAIIRLCISDLFCRFVTGSIARSATCRYLSYPEIDFQVFCRAGATRCTDGGELWHGGGDLPNFTPIGATIRVWTTKTEIFTEIW